MAEDERSGPAIKIEVSDAYMRWLTTYVLLPTVLAALLGVFGIKAVGIENIIVILQEISKPYGSETPH